MFRLLKLLGGVVLLGGFVWLGLTVPLGEQTLFGHLRAIGQTKESKDLVKGTREKLSPFVDEVRRRVAGGPDAAPEQAVQPEGPAPGPRTPRRTMADGERPAPPSAKPDEPAAERINDDDRRQLRRVIGTAGRKPPRP